MTTERPEFLLFLSAPPDVAIEQLREVLADHANARITVYLRELHREHYAELLTDHFVHSDKPTRQKQGLIRELRSRFYDEAIVLDFGHWSFWPARCLFLVSRAAQKTVRTERGSFRFSLLSPMVLVRHLLYRHRHRSGAVAGMPPGTPAPFLVASYRQTVGWVVGLVSRVVEYGWRRLVR